MPTDYFIKCKKCGKSHMSQKQCKHSAGAFCSTGDYILTITGISKERAKELAEDFEGGSMMWSMNDNGDIVAYPHNDGQPVTIKKAS